MSLVNFKVCSCDNARAQALVTHPKDISHIQSSQIPTGSGSTGTPAQHTEAVTICTSETKMWTFTFEYSNGCCGQFKEPFNPSGWPIANSGKSQGYFLEKLTLKFQNDHSLIYQKNYRPCVEGQLPFLPQFQSNLHFVISPKKEHSSFLKSECYEGNLTKFHLACLGRTSFN